jgi:polysaccharide pyruvyl transferase CsaB
MAVIGITGSYGGLNHGDEAILTAMIAALRERIPKAEITVFSRDAAHTRAHHDVAQVIPVRDLTRDDARRLVEPLDLLLLGGGGILYDSEARMYLREVRFAQEHGVATMAYAIGAGPLSYEEDRRLIREALPQMRAVTVRDAGAKRILERADVDCAVEVTADPALLLEPLPVDAARLRAEGVPAGRALVGISLREPGLAAPDLDQAAYHAVLAHTADYVVDRFDAEVLFLPMEQCDIRLSHAVIARMIRADHAHVLTGRYDSRERVGLMAHLDMVIAMRLHLLIFAAITGTPLFPLPYAPKVAEFAASLGVPSPPPITADSVGALLAALDRAWDLRHHESERLRSSVALLRERAGRTADIALACMPGTAPLQRTAIG